MKITLRWRQTGKTTNLLYKSAINKIPIITFNHARVIQLMNIAEEEGLDIPKPLVFWLAIQEGRWFWWTVTDVYIDDLDNCVMISLYAFNIIEATLSTN